MRFILPSALSVLFLVLSVVVAIPDQTALEDDLVMVSADRLEADEVQRTVVFYGQVKARQSGMVMYADKMTLHYVPDQTKKVDRLEVEGNLRIVQDDRVATADRGVFLNREGRVLLSGHAEVHQAGNRIVGDEIIYFLNESRSVVTSQPDSRVNAVFRSGSKQQ